MQPRGTDHPKQSHTWWHEQSSTDGFGIKHQPYSAHKLFCASCKACQQGCPSLPCPLSLERTTLLHSVILGLLWLGPVFCLATLHLKGSEAAEMCTADGRNYLAHLTSEIFFFLFLLSLSFPQITPRLGKLIDSLCK